MTELTRTDGPDLGRPASGRGSSREVLVLACAGVVLASLDLFIVNVALPQIARDLHAGSLAQLSWVLNGYAIVYASLLVFFGRLADRYRRDRAFLLGVAVFTLASIACAASTGVGMLIAFRLVQAMGAALVTPTSLGLVLASQSPERRHGAVRAWTATGGLAAAMGPVAGGLLVQLDWRWVFLANVPVGVAALVVGWRRLPTVPGDDVRRPAPLGVALATVGVGALVFGLVEGGSWGWASASVVGPLALGAVLLVAFVADCMRSDNPLIDPGLFASDSFRGASVVALLFSIAFGAMLLSVVLWEQGVWGWSALRSGLGIAPGPLMVPLTSYVIGGRLIARYGQGVVIALGSVAFAAGVAWWALAARPTPNFWSGFAVGMVLTGIGVGLTLPTMMAAASASLRPERFATGAAIVGMVRQVGLALGVALLVALLGTTSGPGALSAFRRAWWIVAALSLAVVVPAASLRRGAPARSDGG